MKCGLPGVSSEPDSAWTTETAHANSVSAKNDRNWVKEAGGTQGDASWASP